MSLADSLKAAVSGVNQVHYSVGISPAPHMRIAGIEVPVGEIGSLLDGFNAAADSVSAKVSCVISRVNGRLNTLMSGSLRPQIGEEADINLG